MKTIRLIVIIVLFAGFIALVTFLTNRPSTADPAPNSSTATPQPARTPANVHVDDTTKWVLAFNEEFDTTTLDANKWVTCYDWQYPAKPGCTNDGNHEQEWYLPGQVSIADGRVTLSALKQPVTVATQNGPKVYPYRSGMISTGRTGPNSPPKWSAKYGYFEARMKVEGGKGVWPAFWLLPTDKSWPPEIDIMELVGDRPKEVLQTYHWLDPTSGKRQKDEKIIMSSDYTNEWHTYAVNWQPDRLDWYIDGKLSRSATGPTVPRKEMEIILNLAIGGQLPGNADDTTPFPRSVQIDFVKVYERRL